LAPFLSPADDAFVGLLKGSGNTDYGPGSGGLTDLTGAELSAFCSMTPTVTGDRSVSFLVSFGYVQDRSAGIMQDRAAEVTDLGDLQRT